MNITPKDSRGPQRLPLICCSLAIAALLLSGHDAKAVDFFFQPAASAPEANRLWQNDANWLDPGVGNSFVPNAEFNEVAIIDNGATAVLTVTGPQGGSSSVVTPGAVSLQNGSGLDIRSTGALFVTQGSSTSGDVSLSGGSSLLVNPGGRLEIADTLVTSNSNDSVVIGGVTGATANLVAGSVVVGGQATFHANADVAVSNSTIFSGGELTMHVASAAAAQIVGQGPASLGGDLFLDFGGFSPSAGQSWNLIEASNVSGNFGSVSSNAPLAFNQTVVLSKQPLAGERVALQAKVEEVLVLTVNRNTGAMTISHPGASSIDFDGYFVGSGSGSLRDDPAQWNSLTESGQYGSDWIETDQTTTNVGELKIGSDAAFGASVNLGNLYDAFAGEFGQNGESDLSFAYRRSSDGTQFPGVVRFVGDAVNSLVLQVDPAGTRDAYLRNTSGQSVEIDAYELLSQAGSLDPVGWDSLDDQDNQVNAWLEGLGVDSNLLAEFDAEGFTTLAPGDALNLGGLYNGGSADLEFNFLMKGESESTEGVVIYDAFYLPGDFNRDDVVDQDDYTLWAASYGDTTGAGLQADGNSDGVVNAADYTIWRDNNGATLSGSSSVAVPEPASLLLLALVAPFVGRRS